MPVSVVRNKFRIIRNDMSNILVLRQSEILIMTLAIRLMFWCGVVYMLKLCFCMSLAASVPGCVYVCLCVCSNSIHLFFFHSTMHSISPQSSTSAACCCGDCGKLGCYSHMTCFVDMYCLVLVIKFILYPAAY